MNPFYHYGLENFLKKAEEFGVSGTVIPDLPYEMSQNMNQFLKNIINQISLL